MPIIATGGPPITRPRPAAAQYIDVSHAYPGAFGTLAMSADTANVYAFMVDKPTAVNLAAVETTVAGDLIRVGIGTFRPTAGTVDVAYDMGEIDVSGAAGAKTSAAISWTFSPAVLYALIVHAKNTVTLRSVAPAHNFFGTSAANGLTIGFATTISLAYPVALPATYTVSSTFTNQAARLLFRTV